MMIVVVLAYMKDVFFGDDHLTNGWW